MQQLLMIGVFWFVSVTGGNVTTQNMKAFSLGTWENHDQLLWTGGKVGDKMELKTEVKQFSGYRLQVVLTKGPDYGIVQFELDGKEVGGKIDLYSSWVTNTPPIPLGDFVMDSKGTVDKAGVVLSDPVPRVAPAPLGDAKRPSGEHKLTVKIVGKNKKSKGTNVGIDRVTLTSGVSPPCDSGSAAQLDELSKLELLPTLRPGTQSIMFSSYDRTGGNNDGFGGTYSKLWVEDGRSVLAVMDGPGVIERIWFPLNCWKRGSMLRIYLDGEKEPAVKIPIEDLFSGKLPQFPKPLVGTSQGGYYCYVPIPYRDGCKVVLDDPNLRFYQVTYTKLPPRTYNTGTFSMQMSDQQKAALARAVKLWSKLGDVKALELENPEWTEVELNLAPGKEQKIDLPAGAQMVRAVMLEGDKEQLDAARDARLEFCWDGAEKPAVDLSTEFFFCQADAKKNIKSLLTGATEHGWYNFMPMPYRKSASLVVRATDKPLVGKLRLATVSLPSYLKTTDFGYFHAAYNDRPTKPGVYHEFLKREGTGHYIGTYMVTRGQYKNDKGGYIPLWLEGDEVFMTDGKLAIHGTGSEDYFNCGWYAVKGRLNGPGGTAMHGFPVYRQEGEGDKTENLAAAYRWHVADPVPFEKEIDAKIEHGPVNKTKANYRSTAFYYEVAP